MGDHLNACIKAKVKHRSGQLLSSMTGCVLDFTGPRSGNLAMEVPGEVERPEYLVAWDKSLWKLGSGGRAPRSWVVAARPIWQADLTPILCAKTAHTSWLHYWRANFSPKNTDDGKGRSLGCRGPLHCFVMSTGMLLQLFSRKLLLSTAPRCSVWDRMSYRRRVLRIIPHTGSHCQRTDAARVTYTNSSQSRGPRPGMRMTGPVIRIPVHLSNCKSFYSILFHSFIQSLTHSFIHSFISLYHYLFIYSSRLKFINK